MEKPLHIDLHSGVPRNSKKQCYPGQAGHPCDNVGGAEEALENMMFEKSGSFEKFGDAREFGEKKHVIQGDIRKFLGCRGVLEKT